MLLYYVMTGGSHAFGVTPEEVERNILEGRPQMRHVSQEADEVLDRMLKSTPERRPTAEKALRYMDTPIYAKQILKCNKH